MHKQWLCILIFSPYFPPHVGGLETHVFEFVHHLSPHTGKIVVFTSDLGHVSGYVDALPKNVEIVRYPAFDLIPNFPFPKFWSRGFIKSWKYIKVFKFSHQMTRTRFFVSSLLPFFYGIKKARWAHVEHGSSYVHMPTFFGKLFARFYDYLFGRLIFRMCADLICASFASRSFVSKFVNREIEVIYRGMDFLQVSKKSPSSIVRVAYVGRLIYGKGVQDLLKVIHNLQKRGHIFYTDIVGAGPMEDELKKLAKQCNLSNIVFHSGKSKRFVYQLLNSTDIFVNPSYSEGLPSAVLEAGYCRCAVIATAVGGTPEIIKHLDNGYLVKPGEISTLEAGLSMLLIDRPVREQMGERLHNAVISKFSWENAIKAYLDVFSRIS